MFAGKKVTKNMEPNKVTEMPSDGKLKSFVGYIGNLSDKNSKVIEEQLNNKQNDRDIFKRNKVNELMKNHALNSVSKYRPRIFGSFSRETYIRKCLQMKREMHMEYITQKSNNPNTDPILWDKIKGEYSKKMNLLKKRYDSVPTDYQETPRKRPRSQGLSKRMNCIFSRKNNVFNSSMDVDDYNSFMDCK
uniref:MADF domain-containing protein n=1 Tax=Strongyloides papillosus TaxID=174720 RepID=A0A0N5BZW6_STREA